MYFYFLTTVSGLTFSLFFVILIFFDVEKKGVLCVRGHVPVRATTTSL